MRIGSLFSGAGGLDMAVEEVFGGDIVWHCEIDKAAAKVLAHRYPDVPNLGDITAVDWDHVAAVDILCGGFPCQDVSAAGKRAGIKDGTRSGLWAIFADAIDHLRPTIVVIENVRGLLSAEAHRDVEPDKGTVGDGAGRPVLRAAGAVLGDLADLGYDAQWTTLAAGDIGAPHRRERVFIVAHASSAAIGEPAGGSPSEEAGTQSSHRSSDLGGERTHPNGRNAADSSSHGWDEGRPESARIVGGSDVAVSGDGHGVEDAAIALLPTPVATNPRKSRRTLTGYTDSNRDNWGVPGLEQVLELLEGHLPAEYNDVSEVRGSARDLLPTPNASDGSGGGQHPDKREGHSRQLIDYVLLLPTPKAHDGMFGSTARTSGRPIENATHLQTIACLNSTSWGKYEPAIRRWESLTRPAPAPTEPNKNGNPRLSAAFSEWLMGWPEGWVTDPEIGISRNDQLKIIGNGVCPQQAVAALRYLLTVDEVDA